ncbi:N-acetylmuramoyl-L-alanine amidase [Paenibacillus sp. J2TS4]|uniref:N-acetylmuramoyl-L-alanine amidase n=1 Tax=Paenibacillus sp. J2TS4 TaxID=2807194 RepID=UPI001B1C2291|nr:peptidoglycan recognition family protein [Paenibacillus sp. J2TS4]GIP35523.1 hypothetical protein J2TS4_47330 [Paenibacillus sp. J2TS4]
MRQITWKGNNHTNSSSRGTQVPFVIVNHISAGSMGSMDSWFTSPNNRTSSAHFGVAKDGRIHQYVDIRRMAWANGIGAADIARSNTPVIRDNPGINPNLYSVSIEHEGMDGDLTEEQFQASVWLHRYIQQQVQEIWGRNFELNPYHVIGHFQVNPKGKPHCPGLKFPWNRLYKALQEGITGEKGKEGQDRQDGHDGNAGHDGRQSQESEGPNGREGLQGEERDTLKLEHSWQWKMLGDALDGLYRKSVNGETNTPLLTDYTWAQKAYTGKLTQSELAWLNLILIARQHEIKVGEV